MFRETESFETNLKFQEIIERVKDISEEWQELFSNIDGKDLCYKLEKNVIFLRYYSGLTGYMPIVQMYFNANRRAIVVRYQVTFHNALFSCIFLITGLLFLLVVIFLIVPTLEWYQGPLAIVGLLFYSISPLALCVSLFRYYLPKYKSKVRQILNIQNGV